jgi:hypothetical protein
MLTHTCPRVTGIFLPRRGSVASHERDVAKVIQTKAQSIRNKSGKGLYKAKIKISRADAEHPNFKRLMSLGLAAAGCVQIVDDLPPMLTADEDGELTVAADFESMAEEKLADAEKLRTEDFERSQVCLAPTSTHPAASPPPRRTVTAARAAATCIAAAARAAAAACAAATCIAAAARSTAAAPPPPPRRRTNYSHTSSHTLFTHPLHTLAGSR